MRCFRRSPATLVNVVQDNINEQVRRVIDTCPLDSKAAQVLGKSVPAVELTKVDIVNLERSDVLEGEQRHSRIERKLFVARYQAGLMVWSQSQARDLSECGVQISQILLKQCLLLLGLGCTVGSNAQARPKR